MLDNEHAEPLLAPVSVSPPSAIGRGPVCDLPVLSENAGLLILFVEDDDADAYLVLRLLNANPRVREVVRVRDGGEALQWIDSRGFEPDLAIVDLRMPKKDGMQLLSEMAARVTVEFPSIVLTSSDRPEDRIRSKRRGASRFITKSDDLRILGRALNRAIATL